MDKATEQHEHCGIFRSCFFGDRHEWLVMTNHCHAPGDEVCVGKRDGSAVMVTLGALVDAGIDGEPLIHCFRIAKKPTAIIRAVDMAKAADVGELEKLYRLN